MKQLAKFFHILVFSMLLACATPRSFSILGTDYASQPPRVTMRWECNGKTFSTQGVGVCEQKTTSTAKVSIKVPPVSGQIVYSNGQLKETQDFNWDQPLDAWSPLDLGEIASTFGDWPVALDVIGMSSRGTLVTRGVIYHRVCDDVTVACSRLVVKYECSGVEKFTSAGEIGKCSRLSGSAQAFRVSLNEARPGAKVYLSAPAIGLNQTFTPDVATFASGELKIEVPNVPVGPMIVGVRLSWVEFGAIKNIETRILMMGFSQEWTGLDQPHFSATGPAIDFTKPVQADMLEVNLYDAGELVRREYSGNRVTGFPKPRDAQIVCAFAWARDSSDQTQICLDANLSEVRVP